MLSAYLLTSLRPLIMLIMKYSCINYSYGTRGRTKNLFRLYLSDMSHCTVVNGEKPTLRSVNCGVPHGSVLGPLFFVIYINDLHRAVGEDYVRLFADDAALFLWNWNLTTLIESTETKFTDLQKQINHKLWEYKFYLALSTNLYKTLLIVSVQALWKLNVFLLLNIWEYVWMKYCIGVNMWIIKPYEIQNNITIIKGSLLCLCILKK